MNHYSKFCRSKEVHNSQEVDDPEDSEDDSPLFVYSAGSNNVPEDEQFYETVGVQGTQVRFQLDTGARANVMSLKTYSNLKRGPLPPLKETRTVLISFSRHKSKPRGEVVLTTRYKDKVENVKFFVGESEGGSVLSGNTCIKLGLLKRVYHLASQELPSKRVELEDYPELFTGLECLPDTYHIGLAEGAMPVVSVVHPPRKVPVPQSKSCWGTEKDGKSRSDCASGRTNGMGQLTCCSTEAYRCSETVHRS